MYGGSGVSRWASEHYSEGERCVNFVWLSREKRYVHFTDYYVDQNIVESNKKDKLTLVKLYVYVD